MCVRPRDIFTHVVEFNYLNGLGFLLVLFLGTHIKPAKAEFVEGPGFICNWSFACSHVKSECSDTQLLESFQVLATGTLWIRPTGTTVIPMEREDHGKLTVFFGVGHGTASAVQYHVSIDSTGHAIAIYTSPSNLGRYGKLVGKCEPDQVYRIR